jgi:hypothetical protein
MKRVDYITGWTDYPFVELGDEEYKIAPIRQITVVAWDGMFATVTFVDNMMKLQVKPTYLYGKRGRLGQVHQISRRKLDRSSLPVI